MLVEFGLRIPSGEGSSAMSSNQEKHSAHHYIYTICINVYVYVCIHVKTICVFVLTWLEHFPHGDAGAMTCKPRLLQSSYRPKVHVVGFISLS